MNVCVIPCECDNFCIILKFNFKIEQCFNHLQISEEFENCEIDLVYQNQTGLQI